MKNELLTTMEVNFPGKLASKEVNFHCMPLSQMDSLKAKLGITLPKYVHFVESQCPERDLERGL